MSEVEKLITGFLNRTLVNKDLEILEKKLARASNLSLFRKFIKLHFFINMAVSEPNKEDIKEKLLIDIRKEKGQLRKRIFLRVLRNTAAAVVIGLGGYFIHQIVVKNGSQIEITTSDDNITLDLGNGEFKTLQSKAEQSIRNEKGEILGTQSGNTIEYKKSDDPSKLVYHTLKVPYGEKFNLVLSDGSKVFLNSGSSLKYPVSFPNDQDRIVFLTGEGFFEVAKSPGATFKIDMNPLEVEVLGTKFNVANYPEDNSTRVILVEGSVAMETKTNIPKSNARLVLEPGFQGVLDKAYGTMSARKVNVELYTSWVNGNLIFRNAPFENILLKLERHYNVDITNKNGKLATESFDATIEVEKETIKEVLDYFKKIYPLEYEMNGNSIIIK